MNFQLDDTIAALASPPGPAARGIVRISGEGVRDVLALLFIPDEAEDWQTVRTPHGYAGKFRLSQCNVPLPVFLYLWPHRRSYTGQPTAELHTVGSPPLLEAVLSELYAKGVRPARPGEFTLRAFLAGRIDLMQAEAVLGVIDAHDHQELEQALRQLAGGISGRIADVRSRLLNLLAELEAGLDFVEEDIEFVDQQELLARLTEVRDFLRQLLEQASDRMQATGRRRVVLAGLPNAGKSTLFNALAGREAALVSEVGGTTRDYLSAELDWNGMAIELIDTAGWEAEADALMRHAQSLRSEQLQQADLIVWCTASDFDAAMLDAETRLLEALGRQEQRVLIVQTKCDMNAFAERSVNVQVSAKTATGLPELIEATTASLTAAHRGERQLLGMTASRCRESLSSAVTSLEQAQSGAELGVGDELVAIEVREALTHLGRILGEVYTDDILDRIFSKFCIGK